MLRRRLRLGRVWVALLAAALCFSTPYVVVVRAAVTATDMAVVNANGNNGTSYTTGASFTPEANRLYVVVAVHSDEAGQTTEPTVTTTTGLSFVALNSTVFFNTIASQTQGVTLFRAMEASGLSLGTYTVNLSTGALGMASFLVEFNGVVTTGADGADAVVQVVTARADASANPTATLAAFGSADNGAFTGMGAFTTTPATAESGWTLIGGDPSHGTPISGANGMWRASNDTTPTFTLASTAWGMVAIELAAAAAGDGGGRKLTLTGVGTMLFVSPPLRVR